MTTKEDRKQKLLDRLTEPGLTEYERKCAEEQLALLEKHDK